MNCVAVARRGALLVALAAGVALAQVVACTSFGQLTPPDADAAVVDASTPSEASLDDAGACPPGAFCDSFDDDLPLPRAWKRVATLGAGDIKIVKGAGTNGTNGLVATFANDNTAQTAFLDVDRGQNGPEAYRAVLAFSARLAVTGSGFILGPRFSIADKSGGTRDLIIDFHDGKTRLDSYTPTCDGGCTVTSKDTPVDAQWHRYVLTLDVRPPNGVDQGDIRYEIDGQIVVSDALTFSLSSPATLGFQVGVTYTGGKAGGTVTFDDVALVVTAP